MREHIRPIKYWNQTDEDRRRVEQQLDAEIMLAESKRLLEVYDETWYSDDSLMGWHKQRVEHLEEELDVPKDQRFKF